MTGTQRDALAHERADALGRYQAEVARHYRWNLGAHLLYGLFGTTGWRLITAPTFVPEYMFRYEFGDDAALGMRIAVVNTLGELMAAVAPLIGGAIADRWSYAALDVGGDRVLAGGCGRHVRARAARHSAFADRVLASAGAWIAPLPPSSRSPPVRRISSAAPPRYCFSAS